MAEDPLERAELEFEAAVSVGAWDTPPVEAYQDAPAESEGDDAEKKSASTRLVELARSRYTFGVSTDGETFAIPRSGPLVVSTLRGNRHSLRGQLARAYFAQTGRAAPQQALADALLVIDGMAQEDDERALHLRAAEHDGRLWLDLGDPSGKAVSIGPDQWTLHDAPPVLFKRTALNSPLPEPEPGGTLDDLWRFLNVAEADRPLVVAWLVATLYADMAHPVLAFFGEQGTGKTTAQRMLVDLVDPSPVPTRKPPRDAESWVTAAAGSWVVGLDNLSNVPDWLSDSICRAVTGDGDVRRKLYTDAEHAVFAYRRCVILNSIDLGALRGDLAERTLPIHLDPITEAHRTGDADIWPHWREAHARTLGALLDLAAGVAGLLPSVRLESKPRMADFARVLAAVDRVLGTQGLDHYLGKQHALASDTLTADPFMAALVNNLADGFEGTATELLDWLTPERPPKGWPASARAATQRLHRHAPALRKSGWHVSDDGARNHAKVVRWALHPEKARNGDPQDPQSPQRAADCGLETRTAAGVADARPADETPLTRAMTASAGVAGVAGDEYGPSPHDELDDDTAREWESQL